MKHLSANVEGLRKTKNVTVTFLDETGPVRDRHIHDCLARTCRLVSFNAMRQRRFLHSNGTGIVAVQRLTICYWGVV